MGGTALKNCEITRMDRNQFHDLAQKVVNNFAKMNIRASVIRCFKSKQDFGDIDILVESDRLPHDWINQVSNALESKEVVPNGDVVSFEADGHQVDIIKSSKEKYVFAYHYFADNDKGNFIGKLTRRMNLKYGHDGLYYVFRNGDQVIENICVTMEPIKK